MGTLASRVGVNNSDEVFFVKGDPMLAAYHEFQKEFGSDEFVLVYLASAGIFSPESHQAIEALVEFMEGIKYEDEPVYAGIVSPYHAPLMREEAGSILIKPVLDNTENPSQAELDDAKRLLTGHPLYANMLVNPDATKAAVVGTLKRTSIDEKYVGHIATEMARYARDNPAMQAHGAILVGGPIFKQQMNVATSQESAIYGGAAVGMCILALLVLFRKKRQVSAAIGVVVIAVVWTVGVMAAMGVQMNLVMIILPLAIIIMGLGSGVHVINEFRLMSKRGRNRKEAVVASLRATGIPCLLTALTTGVGFLSMMTAPVEPMQMLGLFSALGVAFAFLLAVSLVPAVLAIGDDPPGEGADSDTDEPGQTEIMHVATSLGDRIFVRIAKIVVDNARLTATVFAIIAVLLGFGIRSLKVESHFLQAFSERHPFRQAVEHVDKNLGGSSSMEVLIDAGVNKGVFDPTFLARIDQLQKWLANEHGDVVGVTLSATDLFKEINHAVRGERVLPETHAEAAQLMLLYESGEGDPRLIMDHDARRARVSIRTRAMATSRAVALEEEIRARARELFAGLTIQVPAEEKSPPDQNPEKPVAPGGGANDDDDDVLIIEDDDGPDTTESATGSGRKAESPDEDKDKDKDKDNDDEIILIEDEDPPPDVANDPPARDVAQKAPTATGKLSGDIQITGAAQLFVHLAEYVVQSQVRAFSLAAVVIGFLMMLLLRSATLGLAVMVPNILPVLATYGLMGWLGITLDWLTACIAVAALGVAVDGTIHIGNRFRVAKEAGESAGSAARYVMLSIGRALVVTSLVLAAGFTVVAPSIMASLGRFGVLMAVCLLFALLYDLLMTPAVLAWLNPGGIKREESDMDLGPPTS
jgi:predicted RND superfamily exporter protein